TASTRLSHIADHYKAVYRATGNRGCQNVGFDGTQYFGQKLVFQKGILMPHLIEHYSSNMTPYIDMPDLLRALHRAADATGLFAPHTIRTRALCAQDFVVGQGTPDDAFVHIDVRIRPERTESEQIYRLQTLSETLGLYLDQVYQHLRIGISLEIDVINVSMRVLCGTLDRAKPG